MICDPFEPFLPCQYRVKFATERWEHRAAAALRRQVFCAEQALFDGDDADALDSIAIPLVALSSFGMALDDVVGTVRIHQAAPGLWWGSRLAVAAPYRRVSALGTALIRLAVSSARARGCRRFLANVQSQNAPLFHRLHWTTLAEIELLGRPHHHMEADLAHYPPIADAETGFLALPRRLAA